MKTKRNINGVMGQIGRIRERAAIFVEQELQKEGIHGILTAHGSVLIYLFDQEKAVPMKEIVEKVGRVKSTVTGMVNTLEQHGYVEKKKSAEDGRVMLVQLTEKGRAIRPAFDRISNGLLEKLYGDMPQEDRETLARLLAEIRNNLS
jgi:DNA-binding MarR family transcriptional regulator